MVIFLQAMYVAMNDGSPDKRHSAMAVNTDGATLIKIMDIGTPTNISQNQ